MQYSICYVSNLAPGITLKEIQDLLDFCYKTNNELGIKGLLLYSEGNFLQVLEGEKEKVLEVFEKIKKDTRHTNIIQVVGREVTQKALDGYQVDMVKEDRKYAYKIPEEYLEPLRGMTPGIRDVVERMVKNFISV